MRFGTTVGGETLDEFVNQVKRAEADGFAFVSAANIFGHDAVGALTVAGRETERIEPPAHLGKTRFTTVRPFSGFRLWIIRRSKKNCKVGILLYLV